MPLYAFVGGERVTLIDISAIGARIESQTQLAIGSTIDFSLRFEQQTVAFSATVIRSRLDRSIVRDAIIYDTGLDFSDLDSKALRSVRALIRATAKLDLEARRKYARQRVSRA